VEEEATRWIVVMEGSLIIEVGGSKGRLASCYSNYLWSDSPFVCDKTCQWLLLKAVCVFCYQLIPSQCQFSFVLTCFMPLSSVILNRGGW
jgi:hypothetical protein